MHQPPKLDRYGQNPPDFIEERFGGGASETLIFVDWGGDKAREIHVSRVLSFLNAF